VKWFETRSQHADIFSDRSRPKILALIRYRPAVRPNGTGMARRVLPRLLHVARVLFRHRLLGALLGRRKLPPPQAVRKAIEELGLTYIKLGQVLAMQRGLLPEAYIDELALLHDRVPAMDVATVRAIVESELGEPVDSLFLEFSETPLGAASIAQVHDATLWDGRRVAVKVQRPTLAKSSRVTLRR